MYGGQWFLEIVPDYHFTSDGRQPLRFAESKRSGIKVLERNGTVLGQVVMWAELLRPDLGDLFSEPDPHLGFGDLERFTLDVGVNEAAWTRNEDAAERRKAALSWDALPLFRLAPSPYADDPASTAPARPAALNPDPHDMALGSSDTPVLADAAGPDGEIDAEELEMLDAMGADFVPEGAGGSADTHASGSADGSAAGRVPGSDGRAGSRGGRAGRRSDSPTPRAGTGGQRSEIPEPKVPKAPRSRSRRRP